MLIILYFLLTVYQMEWVFENRFLWEKGFDLRRILRRYRRLLVVWAVIDDVIRAGFILFPIFGRAIFEMGG